MLIAIATIKNEMTSQISPQAGRAPFFLIFNGQGKLLKAIKNPFAIGGGGAGFGVAKMLADKGIDLVIAGKFGPNMASALEERGVKFEERLGEAQSVLKEVL